MNACHEGNVLLQLRTTTASAAPTHALSQLPLELFDEIEFGLIVCDGDGLLRFTNQAAVRELSAARLLTRSDNYLRSAPGARGDLLAALRQAAQRGKRSLVRFDSGDDRLLASVLPCGQASNGSRHVLVMLGRRQPCSDLGLEMLASIHGLTLAERRVLAALVREASPRQIADRNAVALSTVRTQIQSIRVKLGARNIEGLLVRAAEVPPMAGALRWVAGSGAVPVPEAA